MLTLPALRAHPGIALRGAFDPRTDARAAFEAEFSAPSFSTLDDMLNAGDIDAVYVASPQQWHERQSVAALSRGYHVLVEKPMAASLDEAHAMAAASQDAGQVLMVGPSHGYDPAVVRAAQLIASGRFGSVKMVTAFNFTDFMFRPRRPEELLRAQGGGVVLSQAAHQIDVVRRLVGQPVASLRAVVGDWDAQRRGDGAYSALMTFAGGAAASLTYSGYAHYDSDELVGWVSELGHEKNANDYGVARRQFVRLTEAAEQNAKEARTYRNGAASPLPTHNEHFGFVLISCERADLRLMPEGIFIYGDEAREFEPVLAAPIPRMQVLDTFIEAILDGDGDDCHAAWGLETLKCCAALVRSSETSAEIWF